jgi:hypothetical protein
MCGRYPEKSNRQGGELGITLKKIIFKSSFILKILDFKTNIL